MNINLRFLLWQKLQKQTFYFFYLFQINIILVRQFEELRLNTVLNNLNLLFITTMKVSFLTCQDRGIYPSAAPPTRLGNEKLPVNLYQGKYKKVLEN